MDKYTYRVTWSEEDGEYVGLCAEFPSLSWLDSSDDKAFRGIKNLVAGVIEDMVSNGEKVPEPLATKKFSGRYPLRMTEQLHRGLSIKAAEQQISLSRFINDSLAAAL